MRASFIPSCSFLVYQVCTLISVYWCRASYTDLLGLRCRCFISSCSSRYLCICFPVNPKHVQDPQKHARRILQYTVTESHEGVSGQSNHFRTITVYPLGAAGPPHSNLTPTAATQHIIYKLHTNGPHSDSGEYFETAPSHIPAPSSYSMRHILAAWWRDERGMGRGGVECLRATRARIRWRRGHLKLKVSF